MKPTILLIASLIIVSSCHKDKTESSLTIEGRWQWVETYGGKGGITYTPESTGEERLLVITASTIETFVDGVKTNEDSYYIENGDCMPGDNCRLIVYGNRSIDQEIQLNGSRLVLIDQAYDGFVKEYHRQK